MTPLEQLINFLCAVDKRIANIDKDSFLPEMIMMATDEAMLLHMHQGLASPCDEPDENEKQEQQPDEKFNGVYYDVRIKTHYFGTNRQVVFVFTNVSAEKDLQRELVGKQYMQIMFASTSHELRTPINGKYLLPTLDQHPLTSL